MGYQNEDSYRRSLVFDIETYPIDGAKEYLEPVSAPSNYSKPEAIKGYVEKATAEQLGRCALDPDLARIVAIGLYTDDQNYRVTLAGTELQEREALTAFWEALGPYPYPRLIGFNVLAFDLPVIIRRSQYLGIPTKPLQMSKYRHQDVDDLMTILNFDGAIKAHSLKFYAKRFGVLTPDPIDGKDIGALVEAGNWPMVTAHCTADLFTTAALARKLGVLSAQPEMAL
jgi:predicted PolB exonuclease-like 3'-5' exonuclease